MSSKKYSNLDSIFGDLFRVEDEMFQDYIVPRNLNNMPDVRTYTREMDKLNCVVLPVIILKSWQIKIEDTSLDHQSRIRFRKKDLFSEFLIVFHVMICRTKFYSLE